MRVGSSLLFCSVTMLTACGDSTAGAGDGGGSTRADAGAAKKPFPKPVADDCITDVAAGAHDFMCGELEFHVVVAKECLEHACGVILDVHGWFMSGADEMKETRVAENGPKAGYITIHPTATLAPGILSSMPEHSWRSGVDDTLLHDFLVRAIDAFHADEERVHLMGFSQGGAMTWRMLCAYPDLFASVAPAAAATGVLSLGGGGTAGKGICAGGKMPAREVPILFMHGTKDALSPFAVAEQQSQAIIDGWSMHEDEVLEKDDTHAWTRYANDTGTVYEFLTHDYVTSLDFLTGHCFPGSDSGSILACHDKMQAFHWGEVALAFFEDHPRK